MGALKLPLVYTRADRGRIVRVTGTGEIAAAEILELSAKLMADPCITGGLPMLVDLRGATTSMRTADLPPIARRYRAVFEHGVRRVAVVAGDAAMFGMSRAYAAYAEMEGFEVQAFRDEAAALAWLMSTPTREPRLLAPSDPSRAPGAYAAGPTSPFVDY